MRIVSNGDKLSVFIINRDRIDFDNINKYMKELILKLKRKYRRDISGFYQVDVYVKDKIGMIIDFEREEEIDFFRDLIDLKVTLHEDSDVYLRFDDYFLFDKKDIYFLDKNYYVNLDEISEKEFLFSLEFCKVIYGEELEEIRNSLKQVVV